MAAAISSADLIGRDAREDLVEAIGAELFQFGVEGFENAVGGEENGVAGDQIEGDFVVLGIRKQAERNAGDANGLDNAVADQKRIRARRRWKA